MAFLTEAANRGSISTGYDIDNSLKLEPGNSEYLKATNTFAYTTPTSNQKGTISFWIKRTEIGNNVSGKQMYIFASSSGNRYANLGFDEFDNLTVYSGDSSWNNVSPYTYNKFRDTSAWYHIVIRYDTTDSTASNRLRVYSNGTEVSWVVAPNITQNGAMTYSDMNGPTWHSWGTVESYFSPSNFFGGYLAEAHFVDGQSLAPTEFGEYDSTSGIWKPKEYNGTYGNCGYYLDFADSGNLGDDESGNGFDFDETNITSADQATDTPTNNFCTMNPYAPYLTRIIATSDFTNGATQITKTNSNAWCGAIGTMGVKSGKWYYEARVNDNDNLMLGFSTFTGNTGANQSPHSIGTNIVWYGAGVSGSYWFYYIDSGTQVSNSSNRGTVWSNGDVLGVALDIDNSRIDFYVNGSLAGSPNTNVDISATVNEIDSTGDFLIPFIGMWRSQFKLNFGGYTTHTISSAASDDNGYGTFEYAPPSGYYAICTKNLAEYG